jgi:peptide/nickel transport system substrate-binding protein
VSECVIVDDYTVRFTCTKPYFLHLLVLGTFEILPQHIYGQGDFNQHPNNRNPIGSGPYKLERWDTGQQIVLVRNDKYWNDARRPRILKRVLQIITDDNAAFQVLLRQDLDMMGLQPEQWINRANTAAFSEKFNKHSYYRPFFSYIGWNSRRAMFSDKRTRRAMTMLLNREEIRETIYYGLAKTISGNFFIDSPEYNKSIEPWPFDPEQAKKLLDEAGWIDSDNDGVRDKDGQPFSFELLITNANPTAEQVATVYQEELKRAGITLSIRPLEWATFLQNVDERKFDAVMLGWSMTPDDDPYQVWHSSQIEAGSNYVGFNNPEADALIEQARTEFDSAKRVELYHRFHAILHEEQPYTFMFCSEVLLALDKRFQNVKIYPLGTDAREWWVPTALQRYQ